MNNVIRSIAPSLLGIVLVAAGCGGGTSQTICETKQQCGGGNDADLDACIAAQAGEADVASAYDCADLYTKYADCLAAKGTCKGSGADQYFSADCGDESDAVEACVEAATALK